MLAAFGGETERLIPLYALGVFTSFTISQLGMVARWRRLRERGWQPGLAINLVGATATGIVAIVVGLTKFTHGAWIVCLLIPLLILGLRGIHTGTTPRPRPRWRRKRRSIRRISATRSSCRSRRSTG